MPKDHSYYENNPNEYYFKLISQSGMLIFLTTLLTYPMDLIHTRMATDMTPKTSRRKYMTAFECFN